MRISDWSSDVCSSDLAAGGAEIEAAKRSRQGLQGRDAAAGRGGKEFEAVESDIEARHDVRRIGDARQKGNAGRHRGFAEAVGQAGRDDEFGAGIQRIAEHSRVQHRRSEEHTSELQSLMRISYAVFCLKKKTRNSTQSKTR